jgi:bifunctional pyridoxal-dependent enzyme with beta-cystathionase and maltose regulon repressor activities
MLGRCDLETLRRRKSHTWRAHPADVIPAFVAEMAAAAPAGRG